MSGCQTLGVPSRDPRSVEPRSTMKRAASSPSCPAIAARPFSVAVPPTVLIRLKNSMWRPVTTNGRRCGGRLRAVGGLVPASMVSSQVAGRRPLDPAGNWLCFHTYSRGFARNGTPKYAPLNVTCSRPARLTSLPNSCRTVRLEIVVETPFSPTGTTFPEPASITSDGKPDAASTKAGLNVSERLVGLREGFNVPLRAPMPTLPSEGLTPFLGKEP